MTANPTGYFCGVSNTRAPITFLSVSTQRIRTYCALECDRSDDCLGFNYRTTGTENCEIIDGAQLVVTESANGWKFYSKCLQDKNICLACRVN